MDLDNFVGWFMYEVNDCLHEVGINGKLWIGLIDLNCFDLFCNFPILLLSLNGKLILKRRT